ncbi:hypothetical protein SMITH_138 [Smithella sp. ME-1]|nr:hypothetical protein SMITH_138 [Smithella sp. ME-1]
MNWYINKNIIKSDDLLVGTILASKIRLHRIPGKYAIQYLFAINIKQGGDLI